MNARSQRFGFLVVPDFSLIALSSAVDPLRIANGVLERRAFEFVVVASSREPVSSSDGIRVVPDCSMADADDFDAVFVVGPNPLPQRGYGETTAWLRRMAARGAALGGIDTGSYFLARAGLLKGYRCTIHWEDRDAMLEDFPGIEVSDQLFEIDRDRYTCSGGVSPLDLMTKLLSQPPGSRTLAEQVRDLLVAQPRSTEDKQVVPLRHRLGGSHPLVVSALELMENNLEEPLRPAEIARCLGISRRQLERLFDEQLDVSPARKYLQLRLERARTALLRSTRAVEDIAQSTGFVSMSHFITRYREAHGCTPAADRARRRA
ncbi:GlxA family transcriptional regulator [Ramlibacter sp. AN1133]|uniref:GlxA family transcriptional regulator n=1 Tax=Ramlibacter sp. AN1133 TaxID=3133429 RepID=UPI0030BF69C4